MGLLKEMISSPPGAPSPTVLDTNEAIFWHAAALGLSSRSSIGTSRLPGAPQADLAVSIRWDLNESENSMRRSPFLTLPSAAAAVLSDHGTAMVVITGRLSTVEVTASEEVLNGGSTDEGGMLWYISFVI